MDTIYALSTVIGRSGVAVIRISGEKALEVAIKLGVPKNIPLRKATFVKLMNDGEVLDHAIVIYFNAPNSFTGEDIIELHTHGSVAVINDILSILSKYLRLAEPGEFTKIAFENGKMDLIAVEALGDLIHSETSIQRRSALKQMSGQLTELYDSWRDASINIMARMEAYIDFPDDDIPEEALHTATQEVNFLINDIEKHLELSDKAIIATTGLHIAIGGEPNVGKSTLLNLITQQDIAIVSDIAGTTRDIIQVKMQIGGVGVTLYDTAGIRYDANNAIEQEGIRRATKKLQDSDFKIYVFDITQNLESSIKLVDAVENSIILLNKCDGVNGYYDKVIEKIKSHFKEGIIVLPFSAKSGFNLDKLFSVLEKRISEISSIAENNLVTTQHRQKQQLLECISYLKEFNLKKPMEIAAQDIRSAVMALECVTGNITLDDVLDKIFTTFCIGK